MESAIVFATLSSRCSMPGLIAKKAGRNDVVSGIRPAFTAGFQMLSGAAPQFDLLGREAMPDHEALWVSLPHRQTAVVAAV